MTPLHTMKITLSLRSVALGALLLLIAVIAAPKALPAYNLEDRVQRVTLENGMRILLVERHTSPTVSFYIRHRVGAVEDGEGRTGAAHLLEHMLFKGTTTIGTKNFKEEERVLKKIREKGTALDRERMKGSQADKAEIDSMAKELKELQNEAKEWIVENEIDRLYSENGAVDLNASTGQDVTTYKVSLPANRIELWARIEADRMTNPVMREFYTERDVVMEERRQTYDSVPSRKLMELFTATAFSASPYRRPIIGWPSDISFLTPDYLEAFFKQYHSPNNTVIAIVGDIHTAKTLEIVKKYFGAIASHKLEGHPVTEEPLQGGEKRTELIADANPYLIIGWHKPTLPAAEDYVFDVIEALLSKGRTSRFHRSIVQGKQIAEDVSATNGMPAARYPNLFMVTGTPRHPHTAEELEQAIYQEIEKLKTEPVKKQELEKIINQLRAEFIRDLSSNSGLSSRLSYYEIITGDYRYLTRYVQMIEKVTPKDVMAAAKKYLTEENRTVAVLKKKEKP
ncbi:MAG TPA: pitrilysin family protein [Syntrophales bacterium]|nr:pitrilysin family protein [Syntrophales bacterium]